MALARMSCAARLVETGCAMQSYAADEKKGEAGGAENESRRPIDRNLREAGGGAEKKEDRGGGGY